MIPVDETADGVVFNIRVIPRSSRCELAGIQGTALKLRITAPPVEGAANEECIRFLSKMLGVKRSQIRIVAGLRSKNKRVSVSGIHRKDIETAT
ncbi:MAG: YggU family protein [Deltaproteobacteria bacterium]|nr:YggU family protein [Deltaproteobacteria bacterium]